MRRQVLLLNASEEILNVINWKRAIRLMLSGKALKPTLYTDKYEIKTTSGILGLPKAIMLTNSTAKIVVIFFISIFFCL